MNRDTADDGRAAVEFRREPMRPPAVTCRQAEWMILVDAPGGEPARRTGHRRSVLRLNTGRPRGGAPAALVEAAPRILRIGASRWRGWDLAQAGGPRVSVLCLADPGAEGVAVHLPEVGLLILGNAAVVPPDARRARVVEGALVSALAALDAEGVERICGADPRLRGAPFGDEARARVLSLLADVRQVGRADHL